MMGDIDWFGTIFGAVPEGEIAWNARVAKAMIRTGLAPVLIRPGTKMPACTLKVADAKKADLAAQDAAKERGAANYDRVRHECGVNHALTEEKQLNHKVVKELLEAGANLAVSFKHSPRRVMVVDVDTDAERRAFLDDWALAILDHTPPDHVPTQDVPLTVTSPGVYAEETWKHKDGGHLWFDVADDAELPDTKGKATWCACHQFALPSCEKSWTVFWGTGYVLVPPSVRPEGAYRVTGEVLEAPAWLIEIARESVTAPSAAAGTGELNADGDDTINSWSANTPWATILTADGWTEWGTDNCGCSTWTLPGGASNPKSATAHEVGCGRVSADGGHAPLHIWSDALRPGGKDTLTKLSYVAHTRHGGDTHAAMDALGIARGRKDEDTGDGELFVLGAAPGKGSAPESAGAISTTKDGGKESAGELAELIRDFWDRRPVLRNIHDLAWAEFAAPWATLGAVLGYVVALTPPRVRVNDASLNLFVGLVGPPGAGKDAAIRAAKIWVGEYAHGDRLYQRGIGTGQGLEGALVKRVKDKETDRYVDRQVRENIMVLVSEIDQITAHAKQQASTLIATLRQAWMGQMIGGMYKDASKDLAVAEHAYRVCMLVGIQPGRAQSLIQDATGGLPQRFLWVPTTDPTFPDNARSFRPEPWEWKPPVKCRDLADPFTLGEEVHEEPEIEMGLCQIARDQMDAERVARLRGTHDGDELSTHDTLGRLKTAAALSLLDGRTDITEEDWELADIVTKVSQHVRTRVIRGLEAEERKRREAEKLQRVEVEKAIEQAKDSTVVEQAAARIARVLAKNGSGWMSQGKVRAAITPKARLVFEDAIGLLLEAGRVEKQESAEAIRYRIAQAV